MIHNAIKYGTDVLRGFSRYIGLGEDEEGTVRLGETLTPVLDVWARPDAALLRREKLMMAARFEAALAGNFSRVLLALPAGSGIIAVVTLVSVSVAANLQVAAFTNLATLGVKQSRDSRILGSEGRADISGGTAAVDVASGFQIAGGGNAIEIPIVLTPGNGLIVGTTAVNVGIAASFLWSERLALPGELVG